MNNYPAQCFPAWQVYCQYHHLETLGLIEYGSFLNANITNKSPNDPAFIEFEFQKVCSAGPNQLCAKNSTLPFLRPNIEKLEDGLCLEETSKYRQLVKKYYRCLENSIIRVRANPQEHKKLLIFYKKLNRFTKKPKSLTLVMKPWLESCVKMKLELDHKEKNDIRLFTGNWLYSGGCLSFLKNPDSDNIGFVLHASGSELDTLTVTPVRAAEDGMKSPFMIDPCEKEQQYFPIKTPIYQIQSSSLDNDGFCVVRSKDTVSLFQLMLSGSFRIIDRCEGLGDLTSSVVSPYLPAEYVLSFKDGTIYCRDGAMQTIQLVHNGVQSSPNIENWWHCSYGAHPKEFMVASRSSFIMKDLRSHKSETSLFSMPNKYVNSDELIYQTLLHPRNDFQHFIATTHKLLLLDVRYPWNPLLHWHHCLTSPPLFCTATLDVLENNQDIVILGSQESQETMCFQTGLTSHQTPCSTSSPWRMSSFDKCLKRQVLMDEFQLFNQRLAAPLIGLCSVPHSGKGFTGLLMSSYGDIFGQSYFSSQSVLNKTWDSSCEDDLVSYCNDWLQMIKEVRLERADSDDLESNSDESESDQYQKSSSVKSKRCTTKAIPADIMQILDIFKEPDGLLRHRNCPLCSNTDVDSDLMMSNEYCMVCEMLLKESNHLITCSQKQLVLKGVESDNDNFSLNFVDLTESQDPVSRSLLKVWQDEEQAIIPEIVPQQTDIRFTPSSLDISPKRKSKNKTQTTELQQKSNVFEGQLSEPEMISSSCSPLKTNVLSIRSEISSETEVLSSEHEDPLSKSDDAMSESDDVLSEDTLPRLHNLPKHSNHTPHSKVLKNSAQPAPIELPGKTSQDYFSSNTLCSPTKKPKRHLLSKKNKLYYL